MPARWKSELLCNQQEICIGSLVPDTEFPDSREFPSRRDSNLLFFQGNSWQHLDSFRVDVDHRKTEA